MTTIYPPGTTFFFKNDECETVFHSWVHNRSGLHSLCQIQSVIHIMVLHKMHVQGWKVALCVPQMIDTYTAAIYSTISECW